MLDRFGALSDAMSGSLSQVLFGILLILIFWNVVLACFNLLPIPPLDGSKLLYAVFPIKEETQRWLEHYGMFLILFVVLFLSAPISILIQTVLSLFIGLTI